MARKTMDVQVCKDVVNRCLSAALNTREERQAMISLFSEMLHMHNAYNGFRYLCGTEVPVGELPGIRIDPNGGPCAIYADRFRDTDSTRIQFL